MNLLIVDDQAVVAAGLARLLEGAGHSVQWCTDLAGARQALSGPPVVDLLLLDVHLGPEDGLGFAREVRTRSQPPRVLLLTGDLDPSLVPAALTTGAAGIVRKTATPDELVRAVETAAAGGTVLSPDDLQLVLTAPKAAEGLSPREFEVLTLLDAGLSTASMAERLFVSQHTVRGHVQNLLRKLGADSRLSALAEARRRSLLSRKP